MLLLHLLGAGIAGLLLSQLLMLGVLLLLEALAFLVLLGNQVVLLLLVLLVRLGISGVYRLGTLNRRQGHSDGQRSAWMDYLMLCLRFDSGSVAAPLPADFEGSIARVGAAW